MVITELSNGDCFKVEKILLSGEIGKRVAEMGFTYGTRGRVVRRALLGDPIEVRILGYNISLRKTEADGIEVEKNPAQLCACGRKRRCRRGADEHEKD